jgi:1-acyl-sn-glycerol-3-phosphate acyltransferase
MTGTTVPAPLEAEDRPRRGSDPAFRAMEIFLRPPMRLWFNWRFEGLENIPYAEGPVLIACNHLSYFDPPALGYPLYRRGFRVRYLAKSELFKNRVASMFLRAAGQVPVERGTGSAKPLAAASRLLDNGEAVIIFPEGTTTRDPDFRQGPSKTGVARLALSKDLPITPMAIWGTHRFLSHGGRKFPEFGRPIWFSVGEPMSFEGDPEDGTVLRTITDEVMETVAGLTDAMRAEYPERWA